jgi:DNA-binding Lrp family transcriptional regulator
MVSDERLYELVAECEERVDRPVTDATEIAELVDMARQNVHRRLERLRKERDVRKYKPGRAAVYWVDSESDR